MQALFRSTFRNFLLLLAVPLAMSATNAFAYDASLSFSGAVGAAGCAGQVVTPGSTISLGVVPVSAFSGPGAVAAHADFAIDLSSCVAGLTPTVSLLAQPSPTDPNGILNTLTDINAAVEVYVRGSDDQFHAILPAKLGYTLPIMAGATLNTPMEARFVQGTGPAVQPGPYFGSAVIVFSYS